MGKYSIVIFSLALLFVVGCGPTEKEIQEKASSRVEQMQVSDAQRLKSLNDSIIQNPNNANLYKNRAEYYTQKGNLVDAIADYQRAFSIDTTKVEFLLSQAELYMKQGNLGESKRATDRALLQGANVKAYLINAELFAMVKNFEGTIAEANNALKIDVYNDRAYFLKGLAYKDLGDTSTAISSLLTCVEQNPQNFHGHLLLGVLNAAKGDSIAVNYYNNALKIDSNSIEALYNKALFIQSNRPYESLKIYNKIQTKRPDYFEAQFNTGYVHLVVLNDPENAVSYFESAFKLRPGFYRALYNAAYCYELLENKAQAVQLYKEVLKMKPDFTLAAEGLNRLGV